ncbi:DNA primase [Halobium salinum]|uniref:DNA primase large subunit PriL n=1 Tax=Halobium salinum TaxID=1364940 RepID=A0ABD5PFN3_9EURY|nr:DNA primase large subunit PriL [Halobium salinum]
MRISQRHARYPFFEVARDAVEAAELSLPSLVAEEAPAVERGRERVERALLAGTVESETPREWSAQDELLSYPIARILVSLLDSEAAVRKYAAAEAETAAERIRADVETGDDGLRSTGNDGVSLDEVLAEFDLAETVVAEGSARAGDTPQWFRVGVGAYLDLQDPNWGDDWRLVNRELAEGRVRVEREELYRLLREAVARRVAEGLPFQVRGTDAGDDLADALEEGLDSLRGLLADRGRIGSIDVVVPDLFPPCMTNLVHRAREEVRLAPHEGFALMAFLTGIGMDTDEILAFCDASSLDREGIRYQIRYLRDERGTQYPPPSCETLAAYGLCHNEDEHWKIASHPLVYYKKRLAAADEDSYTDWRDARQAKTDEAGEGVAADDATDEDALGDDGSDADGDGDRDAAAEAEAVAGADPKQDEQS